MIESKRVMFEICGKPVAKGRPRFTRNGHAYTPAKTVEFENLVKLEYQTVANGFRFPDDAPLGMTVTAFFPIPKSTSKKKQALMKERYIRPCKKPDGDNILKAIADALNEIAYKDDSQIVECTVKKYYSVEPKTYVEIYMIAGERG